jgi:hypothetical protein
MTLIHHPALAQGETYEPSAIGLSAIERHPAFLPVKWRCSKPCPPFFLPLVMCIPDGWPFAGRCSQTGDGGVSCTKGTATFPLIFASTQIKMIPSFCKLAFLLSRIISTTLQEKGGLCKISFGGILHLFQNNWNKGDCQLPLYSPPLPIPVIHSLS